MSETVKRIPVPGALLEREARLAALSQAYHADNTPLVDDATYDGLVIQHRAELEAFTAAGGSFESAVMTAVGAPVPSGVAARRHSAPMLSLDNTFDAAGAVQWMSARAPLEAWCAEPKIDGLSVALVYHHGGLVSGTTRGDGETGEDVTASVMMIADIPKTLTWDGPVPARLEIRGEAYMSKADFLAINAVRAARGEDLLANPRNAAAGTLRLQDRVRLSERPLSFFPWGYEPAGTSKDCVFHSQSAFIDAARGMGFTVPDDRERLRPGDLRSPDDIEEFYARQNAGRSDLPYDVDGIVLKVDDLDKWPVMGTTARAPRYAVSLKYPAQTAITVLQAVTWQVGRSGILTPVAELQPVGVGGVIVSRATLHNLDEIRRKGFAIGDRVELARSGDVIPKLLGVVEQADGRTEILPPAACPCCGSLVVDMSCTGGTRCMAQRVELLGHAVSRGALDVDGLAAKSIQALAEAGLLTDVASVFRLHEHEDRILALPRMSARTVGKLLDSVERARQTELYRFIWALSIPDVGEETAKSMAARYRTHEAFLSDIRDFASGARDASDTLSDLEGMGRIRALKIAAWSRTGLTGALDLASLLRIAPLIDQAPSDGVLSGQVVVFTGTFRVNRDTMSQYARKLGARCEKRITGQTTLLVAGEKAGSKIRAAQEKGIETIDEATWFTRFGE